MENLPNLPFSKDDLKDALENGLITMRKHPYEDLYIFNYSPKAQYERVWNDVTKTCRGLILSDEYNIISRPFQKIFNYTEIVPDKIIFDQPPVVHDKLDGSLGILYKGEHRWEIATRGSFESNQADWATEWFNNNFPSYDQPDNVTCLFEIIYPNNRICVDYGERAELVLIAAINNTSGSDFPLNGVFWWDGPVVDQVTGATTIDDIYRKATSHEFDGKEGVVCVWYKYGQPAFRLKVKHPEYVRLHGIIHNFSTKKVWEVLSQDGDFLSMLKDVPDEFYQQVKQVVTDLYQQFTKIETTALRDYGEIKHLTNRKDFAKEAQKSAYPAILFRILDNQNYNDIIWKLVKPKGED